MKEQATLINFLSMRCVCNETRRAHMLGGDEGRHAAEDHAFEPADYARPAEPVPVPVRREREGRML